MENAARKRTKTIRPLIRKLLSGDNSSIFYGKRKVTSRILRFGPPLIAEPIGRPYAA
jgi:hypothetical protein